MARRIASTNNELHILNASQELFANGVANLLGSVSSAYPVSGSFSRSSLNQGMYYCLYLRPHLYVRMHIHMYATVCIVSHSVGMSYTVLYFMFSSVLLLV